MDRFVPSGNWNTTNLYFADPAGNILEFVARHDFPVDRPSDFDIQSVQHVSKVEWAVPDVAAAVRGLEARYGLTPFNGGSDTFTAVGGHSGMFIVMCEGRGRFPAGQPAVRAPFSQRTRTPSGVLEIQEQA